ncbi:MAG: hypothetical protein PHC70_01075 [Patescibacteria group bacterium]|nr:hypothetical protein [Patescibacteria group bacterium]
MLDRYATLFIEYPPLEKELRPLLDQYQELREDGSFLGIIICLVNLRPQAFSKPLCAQEPSEAGVRQMELFLSEREGTCDIFPWIVRYQNNLTKQSDTLAAAFHRPEMIRKAVGFLHRCALRIMEDCRAEIGRRVRSKCALEGHKLK